MSKPASVGKLPGMGKNTVSCLTCLMSGASPSLPALATGDKFG